MGVNLTAETGFIAFARAVFTLRDQRESLIASNIANADTPGYKAVDINFQKAFARAMAGADENVAAPVEFVTRFPARLDGNDVSSTAEKLESLQNVAAMNAETEFLHQDTSNLITALRPNPNGI